MINPNLRLVHWAKHFLYVREHGENAGPDVEMFQRAVDGKAQGEPWCAAFVCFLIQRCEAEFQLRSPLFKSENVWQMWERTPHDLRRLKPEPGSLICWNRPEQGKPGLFGHVGIVRVIFGDDEIITIEGNTNARGSREGEGVYMQEWPRPSRLVLLGFLRAFPEVL